MNQVLVLTGTCGSGKSTIAQLLADQHGWARVSEDEVWRRRFHKDRGTIGSHEHRRKRTAVREEVLATVRRHIEGAPVVIDATVHEADPSSLREYEALLAALGAAWQIRVLHPRPDVAVTRDATREGWHAGAVEVEQLWRKFSGRLFDPGAFLDTSDDEPADTAQRVLASLAVELPPVRTVLHSPADDGVRQRTLSEVA